MNKVGKQQRHQVLGKSLQEFHKDPVFFLIRSLEIKIAP